MEKTRRILIVGEPLYLMVVEAALREIPGIETIHGDRANVADGQSPDAVIVSIAHDLASALGFIDKYPTTPVFTLDEHTHILTLLNGERTAVRTPQDLVDALERYGKPAQSARGECDRPFVFG